jgi:hypothetical protein
VLLPWPHQDPGPEELAHKLGHQRLVGVHGPRIGWPRGGGVRGDLELVELDAAEGVVALAVHARAPGGRAAPAWRRPVAVISGALRKKSQGNNGRRRRQRERHDASSESARIFARWRWTFAKLEKMGKVDSKLLERFFLYFAKKN